MPEFQRKIVSIAHTVLVCLLALSSSLEAGVSREIQNTYVSAYENRAMYLKIPIHGARQMVFVRPSGPVLDTSTIGQPAFFRVGDQVRITNVDFRNEFVRFKVTSIDGSKLAELHFMFPSELTSLFPQKPYFDAALDYALTQGQSYKDIEAAKEEFVEGQFDLLLNQFAATAGIGRDQLIERITRESPDYQKAKSELSAKTQEAERQKQELTEEKQRARTLANENAQLQRSIREAESAADSLKEERLDLLDDRDSLRKQLAELESAQAESQRRTKQYEQQVDDLIRNLDVTSDSTGELGNKVASLSTVIDSLKLEGSALTEKLQESSRRVADLLKTNQDLEQQVKKLGNEKARLDSNLKVLTTGKNSVNKTLLEVQEERNQLQAARQLQSALSWTPQDGSEKDNRVAVISLGAHKIADIEFKEPVTVGETYAFRFHLDSPDLVKFDEEERALYENLGEDVKVQLHWRTPEGIQAQLVEGEEEQTVEPRGDASWKWSFSGDLRQPQPVVLAVNFKDSNGHEVHLAEREFILRSTGLLVQLGKSFSFWSLLLGVSLGLAIAFVIWRSKPVQRPPHPVEYMARKQL